MGLEDKFFKFAHEDLEGEQDRNAEEEKHPDEEIVVEGGVGGEKHPEIETGVDVEERKFDEKITMEGGVGDNEAEKGSAEDEKTGL